LQAAAYLAKNRPCWSAWFSVFSGSFLFSTVVNIAHQGAHTLSLSARLRMAAAGLCLVAALAVAGWLRPDPNGFGTHRQLGLPPCTFIWLFGVRCPSCGMTTAWSHAVHGHWLTAIGSNAGGALLAATAMVAAPWLLFSAARARWLLGRPGDRAWAALASLLIAVTLLDWFYRLGTPG
jgi:hypothetical protein